MSLEATIKHLIGIAVVYQHLHYFSRVSACYGLSYGINIFLPIVFITLLFTPATTTVLPIKHGRVISRSLYERTDPGSGYTSYQRPVPDCLVEEVMHSC